MSFDADDSNTLNFIESHLEVIAAAAQPDLATRVAADIYVRDYVARDRPMTEAEVAGLAVHALKCGRLFAEAFANQEPKP